MNLQDKIVGVLDNEDIQTDDTTLFYHFKCFDDDFPLIEMVLRVTDYLIGFVTLARKQDGRPFLGGKYGGADGLPAVGDADCLHPGLGAEACLDLLDDVLGLLGAAVVGGDDDSVGEFLADCGHLRPLGPVPVASATEEAYQLVVRSHLSERL